MAHISLTRAALTLALPLLAAGTTLSAEPKPIYNGLELIRGLYVAADIRDGPVRQDYVMAREMLFLEKDDGTKVFMTQYDFSPMWDLRPYLFSGQFPNGAVSTFEQGHADPASFGPATSIMFEQLKDHLVDLYSEAADPMSDTGSNSFSPPEVVIIRASEEYNKLMFCNRIGNDINGGSQSFFKDPNGPDCQLYEAAPSLGNLVAEKPTMELMQYDFDQDIGAIVSSIGVSGDQISLSIAGFDRQTKRMQSGFNGWENWLVSSQADRSTLHPKVTCKIPASRAEGLSKLVPGSVLMVRASIVSIDANSAVFDCTPA